MKETGMVRRIDELGRVVIPKEIRRTLRLKESDPLEIFTERDMLCFKKYSPISSISSFAEGVCGALADFCGRSCFVTDTDSVVSAAGAYSKEFEGKPLVKEMTDVILNRQAVTFTPETYGTVKKVTETSMRQGEYVLVVPSIAAGDVIGSVIVFSNEPIGAAVNEMAKMCAEILSRQF